jgi:Biotin synthase and related enzymes
MDNISLLCKTIYIEIIYLVLVNMQPENETFLNRFDRKAYDIIAKGWNKGTVTKEECTYLLGFDPLSLEMSYARMAANDLVRKCTGNTGSIVAQVGLMLNPCPADCKFCNFAASQSKMEPFIMSDDEFTEKIKEITMYGDVTAMCLMTMHNFDIDEMKHKIKLARKLVPKEFNMSLNAGDMDYETCIELKAAGANKAYHVCRLREGTDTRLDPKARIQTMKNMISAGIPVCTHTEPVGPEHSDKELADNFFLGIEAGCDSFGVMRRIATPGTPLAHRGQISEARVTQLSAVFSLVLSGRTERPIVNIHEPCQLGLFSGATVITAEYGGNPRDVERETEKNRGFLVQECRKMLYDAGFEYIQKVDGSKAKLNIDYLKRTKTCMCDDGVITRIV